MIRLNATNVLGLSIQLNQVMLDEEAEAGQIANSSEDAEVEDDDGSSRIPSIAPNSHDQGAY